MLCFHNQFPNKSIRSQFNRCLCTKLLLCCLDLHLWCTFCFTGAWEVHVSCFEPRVTDLSVCSKEQQTSHHLPQSCRLHNPLGQRTWPDLSPLMEKLSGDAEKLRWPAICVREIGVEVWVNNKEEESWVCWRVKISLCSTERPRHEIIFFNNQEHTWHAFTRK